MYVLEYSRGKKSKMISYEDFEFLLREKERKENSNYKCVVYKISNNGSVISRLSDKSVYELVTNYNKELRKQWKQYRVLREWLVKAEINDFYVKDDILHFKAFENEYEVEMIRKTPRYTLKINGEMINDSLTSQVDIINVLSYNGKLRKKILKRDYMVRGF